MEIVLTKKVEHLGERGEVKDVKDGYGRNYLLPNELALLIDDPRAKKMIEEAKEAAIKEQKEKSELEGRLSEISGMELAIYVKVGEKKQLFSAVTEKTIMEEAAKKWQIEAKEVGMSPIKGLGQYEVKLKFSYNLEVGIKVRVEAEK